MKLQPGKYIIKRGRGITSQIEYWMVMSKNGKTVLCIDNGIPFIAKPGDNEIYLDDDLKILKRLEISQRIGIKKVYVEIHTTDEFGFTKVFKVLNNSAFDRVLKKFPGVDKIWNMKKK